MSVTSLAIHTITVQRRAVTKDAMGAIVEVWTTHLKVSARVQPLSGRESRLYSTETSEVDTRIYVPGAPDIVHTDRVLFRGVYYQIVAVRNVDEWDRFLTLECMRGTTPAPASAGA